MALPKKGYTTPISVYMVPKAGLKEPEKSVLRVLSDRFGHTGFKSELQGQAVEAACQGKTTFVCFRRQALSDACPTEYFQVNELLMAKIDCS